MGAGPTLQNPAEQSGVVKILGVWWYLWEREPHLEAEYGDIWAEEQVTGEGEPQCETTSAWIESKEQKGERKVRGRPKEEGSNKGSRFKFLTLVAWGIE